MHTILINLASFIAAIAIVAAIIYVAVLALAEFVNFFACAGEDDEK